LALNSAIQGTLNIVKSCAKNGIKKLVITSSTTAIKCVMKNHKELYTENDFSDLDYPSLYPRSKVNAEI